MPLGVPNVKNHEVKILSGYMHSSYEIFGKVRKQLFIITKGITKFRTPAFTDDIVVYIKSGR